MRFQHEIMLFMYAWNVHVQLAQSNTFDHPEYKLQHHMDSILNGNYNRLVRPIRDHHKNFSIYIVLLPQTLINIDSNLQHMIITGYLTVEWLDEYINWEPSEFGGIHETQLPVEKLWVPTLCVFNALGQQSPLTGYTNNLFVYRRNNKTRMRMYVKKEFYTACEINILNFPNDKQSCRIEIISLDGLHHNQRQLMQLKLLQKNTAKTWVLFSNHSAWHLYNASQTLHNVLDRKVYSYTLFFHRYYHFYFINVIGPLIILSFLSHVVYILPPNNVQRINIGVAVFISYTVFMLLIQNILPRSIEMPHISVFMFLTKLLSFITIVVSVIVLTMHETKSKPPTSTLVRCLFRTMEYATEMKLRVSKSKHVKHRRNPQIINNECAVDMSPMFSNNPTLAINLLEEHHDSHKLNQKEEKYWKRLSYSINRIMFTLVGSAQIITCTYFVAEVLRH